MDQRKTSAATLGVLAVLCIFGLVFGVVAVTDDFPQLRTAPEPACKDKEVEAGGKVRVGEVTVSVYNAGTESGAASKTLQRLIERGFGPGSSGNAPEEARVGKVQIWAEDAKNPAVRLVRRQFKGRTRVVADRDPLGAGVTVVLGNGFDQLAASAPKTVVSKEKATICSPN